MKCVSVTLLVLLFTIVSPPYGPLAVHWAGNVTNQSILTSITRCDPHSYRYKYRSVPRVSFTATTGNNSDGLGAGHFRKEF